MGAEAQSPEEKAGSGDSPHTVLLIQVSSSQTEAAQQLWGGLRTKVSGLTADSSLELGWGQQRLFIRAPSGFRLRATKLR